MSDITIAPLPKPSARKVAISRVARRHRAVHRVQGPEHRADGHEKRDQNTQCVNQLRQHDGMFRKIVGFTRRFDVQARLAGQIIGELREHTRRIELHIDRLIGVAPVEGGLQQVAVGPDFRFRRPAAGGKNADHRPFGLAHFDCAATSKPPNSWAAPAPAMTSLFPHSFIRPAIILMLPRTWTDAGSTPRNGTLASVPVERLGTLIIT